MSTRDVISFFSRRGKILTDFLGGGGQNMKKKSCMKKHQKITIFTNQGGGANAPPSK